MSKHPPLNKKTVGTADFKARCLEYIDQVKEARAEYIVTRHGEPVARLVPIERTDPASLVGCMKGTVLKFERPFDPVPATWSIDQPDPSDPQHHDR